MLDACPLPDALSFMIPLVPLCSRVAAAGQFPISAVLVMSYMNPQPSCGAPSANLWYEDYFGDLEFDRLAAGSRAALLPDQSSATILRAASSCSDLDFRSGPSASSDHRQKASDATQKFAQALGCRFAQRVSFLFHVAETGTLHLLSGSAESFATYVVHLKEAECLGSGIPPAAARKPRKIYFF